MLILLFNEEENIRPFYEKLKETLPALLPHSEILFIDDGSRDETLKEITEVDVIKYDVDEHEDLTASKKIRNVPVLIFYDGDKEVDRLIGAVSLKTINETIDKWK